MKFMIIINGSVESEAGEMPDETTIRAVVAYHRELATAGVLVEANGLQPSRAGWRIAYAGGQRRVIDGPFAEAKEMIAGYTIIDVASRAEAVAWSKKFPNPMQCEGHIEVRPLFECGERPSARRGDATSTRSA
jgi:hypothetical protein